MSFFTTLFILSAFFSHSTFATYQPGFCKYRPGDIKTPINKDPAKI